MEHDSQKKATYEHRYKLLHTCGCDKVYVTDITDGKDKVIPIAEMLDDIFADPIFDDIN